MATIAEAQAKWERKMATAGEAWKRGVTGRGDAYCRGVAQFLGVGTCNPLARQKWEQGVAALDASAFQRAVAGKGSKWAENLRRALGG